MEMQTKDKSFECAQCNLSFKMMKDLKTHMLQHEGKKPHSCNQCGYSNIRATKLKRHMLIHSGDKPFSCEQCEYSSTHTVNLRNHMLTHSVADSVISPAHKLLPSRDTC